MARLSRTRNCVEPPFARARRRIIGVNESPNAIFAAGNAHEHQILNQQRRQSVAVALAVFGGFHIPDHIPRLAIQGDDVRVQRRGKHFVAEDREAAVHASAARFDIGRQRALVLPDGPPRLCIQREHAIFLPGTVQNSVHDQRRGLKFSAYHRLVRPLGHQRSRIRSIDLIQRAEPVSRIVARIHQPVLRLLRRIEQSLRGHLRRCPRRQEARYRNHKPHHNRKPHHNCKLHRNLPRRQTEHCHFERSRPTVLLPSRSCERSACVVEKSLFDRSVQR